MNDSKTHLSVLILSPQSWHLFSGLIRDGTSNLKHKWLPFLSKFLLYFFPIFKFPSIFSVIGVRTLKNMFNFQCTFHIFLYSMFPVKWSRFFPYIFLVQTSSSLIQQLDIFLTFHLIFSLFSPYVISHSAIMVAFPNIATSHHTTLKFKKPINSSSCH